MGNSIKYLKVIFFPNVKPLRLKIKNKELESRKVRCLNMQRRWLSTRTAWI